MKFLAAALLIAITSGAQAQTVTTVASDLQASGGVSMGPGGNIYVADFGSSLRGAGGRRIWRISPDGEDITAITDAFAGASGNAFGGDGALYQSDVARGEAWRVTMDGERALLAEGLQSPVGIVRADDGHVYVTECGASAITRILPGGVTERIAQGAPINCPNGLALGPDGALYTVNFSDGALLRIAPGSGEVTRVATIPGGGNGHLAWANDRFYVASFRGHRIFSVTLTGEVCLIAGSGEPGNADGEALEETFFRPNGVAITPDGDTLYTNTVTAIVRRESPLLHLNALRRVDGLKSLLDCPPGHVVSE